MAQLGYKGEKLDILIVQGADFGPYIATMTNPDGSPVNLTSCLIRGAIAKSPQTPAIAAINVMITNANAGQYQFGLTHGVTMAFTAGRTEDSPESRYMWQLELVDSTGHVTPLYYGDAAVFRGLVS
ncbi:hypothetical protein BH11PSE12_BH11PSE12_08190 [soil metagenome]